EDGIRDFHVTGVQTCALPICISDLLGKGKKSRKAPTDPSTLTPPPVQPSTTRRPVDTDGPADETPSGSIPEGQQETDTIPERRSSVQYTGGDADMGRIHEAAQELAEAIRRHPLENTKDLETFLEDLGLAGNLIAEAETAAASRVHEESPADAQVRESLELTARQKRTAARAAEGLRDLYRRKHNRDYERFEKPRSREEKLDYRNNRDVI